MQEDTNGGRWFKRKLYGWGWYPATWQGWVVASAYVAILLAAGLTVDDSSAPREVMFTFALPVVLATVTLIRVCYKKGERPRWQWGEDKEISNK